MSPDRSAASEREAVVHDRLRVQLVLRLGLGAAIGLLAAGLVAALMRGPSDVTAVSLTELLGGAPAAAERLCGLGVLVLALTPALRVLALIALWAKERDWKYVAVASAVAAVLGLAVWLGGG